MKKVTAFIGSQRKKATYQAVQEFEKTLKQHADIDFEYVFLSDYRLEYCTGCLQCFMRGEEVCPSKDDRDLLLKKIEKSDGVVFATPNYAFQVSGRMKNLFDRLSFIYHRPRFFGKACTAIVTQGVYGGAGILKYLNFAGEGLGFHMSKGCCVTTWDPMTASQRVKMEVEIKKASARFLRELLRPAPPPSFFRLIMFRMARTSVKTLDPKFRDHQYYKAKGWFESGYYYPTSLGLVKRLVGRLADLIGGRLVNL